MAVLPSMFGMSSPLPAPNAIHPSLPQQPPPSPPQHQVAHKNATTTHIANGGAAGAAGGIYHFYHRTLETLTMAEVALLLEEYKQLVVENQTLLAAANK
jgi:hypothetical protein